MYTNSISSSWSLLMLSRAYFRVSIAFIGQTWFCSPFSRIAPTLREMVERRGGGRMRRRKKRVFWFIASWWMIERGILLHSTHPTFTVNFEKRF